MKKSILIIFTLLMAFGSQAQEVLDGMFIKETAPTRRVVPYTHIREADVMYYKRIWRVIDLNEKINHPLYYPIQPIKEIGYERISLFELLKRSVEEGTITAYEEEGDGGQFKTPLTKSEAINKLSEEKTEVAFDPATGLEVETSYNEPINASEVSAYWLKEDWVFDRERSVMEARIIGIMPIITKLNTQTDQYDTKGLFWIYFREARYVFANQEVYNPSNDGSRLTFEDLFRKRIFSSYIYRETNVYDNRMLDTYRKNGIDRLLEARKVEQEIINFEHDQWQF